MHKIIIDCDPGHDDAIALLLATRAAGLKLLGVTTVAGNSLLSHTTRNARRTLDFAGAADVDVFAGCEKPLMRDLFRLTGTAIHGADGLGDSLLPEAATPIGREHAVDFMIRTLRESEDKVVLVPTGPLTNVALALIKAPDIKEKIDRLVIMGGAVYEAGNITTAAEFNFYVDPEAARIVLHSGCEIYLNTLDATMKALFFDADIAALRDQGDKLSGLAASLLDFYADAHAAHFGIKTCPVHDALCVGVLMDDTLVKYEHTYVDVSLEGPLTLGETVADPWGITGNAPNCHISVSMEREKFVTMIADHLKKPYISKA